MSFDWSPVAARGGKRAGAGAKAKLDWAEQIAIAAEYSKRHMALVAAARARKREETLGATDYDYHAAQARADLASLGERYFDSEAAEDHEQDIEHELLGLARKSGTELGGADSAPRLINLAPARPYGTSTALLRDVATWATELLGKTVTMRQVRSCRDLARSVANEGRSAE